MLNPQQIRKALVRLAEFKQREHYTPFAVREIISNFETHPLKEAILYFCENDPEEQRIRLFELGMVCRTNVMRDLATEHTGIDVRSLLTGEHIITNSTWLKLKQHFDELESLND